MQVDIRVLELLSSKLCHDLISPVSAINNGVELIEDIGGSVVDEAMKLIGDSAVQASRRLKLFRVAYGRAGSEDGLATRDARQIVEQYMMGGRVALVWPAPLFTMWDTVPRGFFKVMLNLAVMAEEVLAYGGTLSLSDISDTTRSGCQLLIEGRGAQLTPHIRAALAGDISVEELTPRSIQAYITGKFVRHFGMDMDFSYSASSVQSSVGTDRVRITLCANAVEKNFVKIS